MEKSTDELVVEIYTMQAVQSGQLKTLLQRMNGTVDSPGMVEDIAIIKRVQAEYKEHESAGVVKRRHSAVVLVACAAVVVSIVALVKG